MLGRSINLRRWFSTTAKEVKFDYARLDYY
jgi:DnaJ-class molecular chaperone